MEHAEFLINIYNEKGEIIGAKKRKDVDRINDIIHCVKVFVCTPDKKVALSIIPDHPTLKSIYVGQFGVTVATMVRHDEEPEVAAARTLQRELFIQNAEIVFVGRGFHEYPEGVRRVESIFYCLHSNPLDTFSREDIESISLFTRPELEQKINLEPASFSPPFLLIWKAYNHLLPM